MAVIRPPLNFTQLGQQIGAGITGVYDPLYITNGKVGIFPATNTQGGYVTTGIQPFEGVKTFVSGIAIAAGPTITEISTDTTLAADSDAKLATQHAVKTYIDTQAPLANLTFSAPMLRTLDNVTMTNDLTGTITSVSTDTTLVGDSNTDIPTEHAVKTYVDTVVSQQGYLTTGNAKFVENELTPSMSCHISNVPIWTTITSGINFYQSNPTLRGILGALTMYVDDPVNFTAGFIALRTPSLGPSITLSANPACDIVLKTGSPSVLTSLTVSPTLITAELPISITDTSDSSSGITGSLRTLGGVGVTKDLYVGGTIKGNYAVNIDGALAINNSQCILRMNNAGSLADLLWDGAKFTLMQDGMIKMMEYGLGGGTYYFNLAIDKATGPQLQIQSSGTDRLDISVDGVGVGTSLHSTAGLLKTSGTTKMIVQESTNATALATGALQIAGGASITKDLFVGGTVIGTSGLASTNLVTITGADPTLTFIETPANTMYSIKQDNGVLSTYYATTELTRQSTSTLYLYEPLISNNTIACGTSVTVNGAAPAINLVQPLQSAVSYNALNGTAKITVGGNDIITASGLQVDITRDVTGTSIDLAGDTPTLSFTKTPQNNSYVVTHTSGVLSTYYNTTELMRNTPTAIYAYVPMTTTSTIASAGYTISGPAPTLTFNETLANTQYSITQDNGVLSTYYGVTEMMRQGALELDLYEPLISTSYLDCATYVNVNGNTPSLLLSQPLQSVIGYRASGSVARITVGASDVITASATAIALNLPTTTPSISFTGTGANAGISRDANQNLILSHPRIKDMHIFGVLKGLSADAAVWEQIATTGQWSWNFKTGVFSQLHGSTQIPHDWAEGTPIIPHVHFINPAAASTGNAVWGINCYIAAAGAQLIIPANNTNAYTPISADSGGLGYVNMYGEITSLTPTVAQRGATIQFRIIRWGNLGTDTCGSDLYLTGFDFHYQANKIGGDDTSY